MTPDPRAMLRALLFELLFENLKHGDLQLAIRRARRTFADTTMERHPGLAAHTEDLLFELLAPLPTSHGPGRLESPQPAAARSPRSDDGPTGSRGAPSGAGVTPYLASATREDEDACSGAGGAPDGELGGAARDERGTPTWIAWMKGEIARALTAGDREWPEGVEVDARREDLAARAWARAGDLRVVLDRVLATQRVSARAASRLDKP